MIVSSRIRFHHPLHLQLEQQRRHLPHGNIRPHTQHVQLQVIRLPQHLHHGTLLPGELRKQLPLFHLTSYLPPHRLDEVLRRHDERRRVILYHPVTPLRERHPHRPREGKHVTPILLGDTAGDQTAPLVRTLHQDGSIRHPRHDTVPLPEVVRQRLRLTHILRQQTPVTDHLRCRVPMVMWIDTVQSMRQHPHRVEAVLQSVTMCMDIHPVRQSTDYQHVRTQLPQVTDKTTDDILPIGSTLPCPHDVNHPLPVQVRHTFII